MRRPIIAAAAGLAWTATLALPVVTMNGKISYGIEFLEIGWIDLLGEGQFGWFANPLMIWAITLIGRGYRVPWAAGALLAACFLSSLRFGSSWDTAHAWDVTAFHSGYYLWMSLVALGAAAPLLNRLRPGPAV